MTCEWHKMPDGTPVVLCGPRRRAPKCSVCARPASLECDFPSRSRSGTCDKALCAKCAVSVGENRDYCPHHSLEPAVPAKQGSLF